MIKRIAPDVEVLDITHGIAPRNVLQGALVLADALPYMPSGVHLGVVDPGVGGVRKALAARGRDGRIYVGPDNGLLLLAADRLGGIAEAFEIANRDYMLHPVSRTFHGRDVFAPAAAHVALGLPLDELGPSLVPSELQRLDVPEPDIAPFWVGATVLSVDRFGNVQLNATGDDLEAVGMRAGTELELEVGDSRHSAVAAQTFTDVSPGEILVYEDSYGRAAIAVSSGDAAERLRAGPGERIGISCK